MVGSQTVSFSGIKIESSLAGVVWFDEVKVVEHLYWPLPEFPVDNHTENNYAFGNHWLTRKCGTYNELHAARDYSVGGETGKEVQSAHHGKVLYARTDAAWGGYVIIGSRGGAFTTTYTHVTPTIVKGEQVTPGQKIGESSPIPGYTPHLHFELRVAEHDLDIELRGVLPTTACDGNPAFPEAFVNPLLIDWQ